MARTKKTLRKIFNSIAKDKDWLKERPPALQPTIRFQKYKDLELEAERLFKEILFLIKKASPRAVFMINTEHKGVIGFGLIRERQVDLEDLTDRGTLFHINAKNPITRLTTLVHEYGHHLAVLSGQPLGQDSVGKLAEEIAAWRHGEKLLNSFYPSKQLSYFFQEEKRLALKTYTEKFKSKAKFRIEADHLLSNLKLLLPKELLEKYGYKEEKKET